MSKKNYLFRYSSTNDTYSLFNLERLLLHNEIMLASPTTFNDPFDCKFLFDRDDMSEEEWHEFYKILINRMDISDQDKNKQFEEITRSPPHHDAKYVDLQVESWRKGVEKAVSMVFIASFITGFSPEDILMWSHYADGHKGYCLEFESDLKGEFEVHKVRYRKKYQPLSDIVKGIASDTGIALSLLLTKSDRWEYENEVRAITDSEEDEGMNAIHKKFSAESLRCIILGCRMPDIHKREIRRLVKQMKIPIAISEAVAKETNFGIDIKPIG